MFPSRSTTISQDQIDRYAQASQDFNPLHVDQQWAATTPFGGTIAHGSIPMNSLLRSIAVLTDHPGAVGATLELKLIAPSQPGDVIVSEGEERDDGTWDVSAVNQRGDKVMVGTVTLTSGERA